MSSLLLVASLLSHPQASNVTMKCDFSGGASRSWSKPAQLTAEKRTIFFDKIDPERGTATRRASPEARPVTMILMSGLVTFVEILPDYNIEMTTVYQSTEPYKAVQSRHVGTSKEPIFSQLAGTCVMTKGS